MPVHLSDVPVIYMKTTIAVTLLQPYVVVFFLSKISQLIDCDSSNFHVRYVEQQKARPNRNSNQIGLVSITLKY